MQSAFLLSMLLSSLYYYSFTQPFFALYDPVPWLRSRLGREIVLVMYGICMLQLSWQVLCPLAYLCPFRLGTLFSLTFLFLMISYLALSHGLAVYALQSNQIFAWWPAFTTMRQSLEYFMRFMYNLIEVAASLVPKSLYIACDCVFVFCLGFTLSRVVFDCIQLRPSQPTPEPQREAADS